MSAPILRTFVGTELVPSAWSALWAQAVPYAHNPSITVFRGRRLMAYRLGLRQPLVRRIAICALDDDWQIVRASIAPFSDSIDGGGEQHYDPRLVVVGDRLFLHYNNNFHTRPNRLYLVEVDPDTLMARSPARLLTLRGPRRVAEKNWMLFEYDLELFAVYSIAPHVVLRVSLAGSGEAACEVVSSQAWDVGGWTQSYGHPSGGSSPVRVGDRYVAFFHSHVQVAPLRRWLRFLPYRLLNRFPESSQTAVIRLRLLFEQRHYRAGVYTFEARPPFRPLSFSPQPVLVPEQEPPPELPLLFPYATQVVFPAGAVALGGANGRDQWLVSYGVHDQRCVLRTVEVESRGDGRAAVRESVI